MNFKSLFKIIKYLVLVLISLLALNIAVVFMISLFFFIFAQGITNIGPTYTTFISYLFYFFIYWFGLNSLHIESVLRNVIIFAVAVVLILFLVRLYKNQSKNSLRK